MEGVRSTLAQRPQMCSGRSGSFKKNVVPSLQTFQSWRTTGGGSLTTRPVSWARGGVVTLKPSHYLIKGRNPNVCEKLKLKGEKNIKLQWSLSFIGWVLWLFLVPPPPGKWSRPKPEVKPSEQYLGGGQNHKSRKRAKYQSMQIRGQNRKSWRGGQWQGGSSLAQGEGTDPS